MKSGKRILLSVATAVCAVAASAVFAQAYPRKPIQAVVPFPPGGSDATFRVVSAKMSEDLGRPIVVINRPGASGVIGSAYVSKAAPDGYTLLLAPSTFAIAQFVLKTTGSNSYDVLNGFAPIIEADRLPLFLVAPDGREKEIQAQLRRPSFKDLGLPLRYLLFNDLKCHCEGLCRFGEDHRVLLKLARGCA